LPQVGFDRRLHVWILQLQASSAPSSAPGAVHLTKRSGRRRMVVEAFEFLFQPKPSSRSCGA